MSLGLDQREIYGDLTQGTPSRRGGITPGSLLQGVTARGQGEGRRFI